MNVKSAMTGIAHKHLVVLVIKCKEKVVVQQNENEKTLGLFKHSRYAGSTGVSLFYTPVVI